MMQLALKNGYSFDELKQLKEWEREELMKGGEGNEENEENEDDNKGGDEPEKLGGDEPPEKKGLNSVESDEQQKQIDELTKLVENLKNELKKAQDTNKRGSSETLETESAFDRMMKKANR